MMEEWQGYVDKGMSYYDAVIQCCVLPNQEVSDTLRRFETQVKLVSFHIQECARATKECAYYTQVVADKTKEIIQCQSAFGFVRRRNDN